MSDQNDSPKSEASVKQKLRDMAKLSVLSNRMSEIQEKNLKCYPFIFFDGVKSVKLTFDLSKVDDDGRINHGDHHVTYDLETSQEQNSMDIRLAHLEKAVRTLFWNDLKVRVFVNGEKVFESKKNG